MTKNLKKGALVLAALLAGAMLFAKPVVSDYQGSETGAKVPAWVDLFDKAVGSSKSGTLTYSKTTKKLYKKLGVKEDKVLYYSVKDGSDKDVLANAAKSEARSLAAKDAVKDGQAILDQKIGEGKGAVKQPVEILGLAKAADFWLETTDGDDKTVTAYSILQITELNKKEAANSLANSFLRDNGYIQGGNTSQER